MKVRGTTEGPKRRRVGFRRGRDDGLPMALRLIELCHPVVVYARNPAKVGAA